MTIEQCHVLVDKFKEHHINTEKLFFYLEARSFGSQYAQTDTLLKSPTFVLPLVLLDMRDYSLQKAINTRVIFGQQISNFLKQDAGSRATLIESYRFRNIVFLDALPQESPFSQTSFNPSQTAVHVLDLQNTSLEKKHGKIKALAKFLVSESEHSLVLFSSASQLQTFYQYLNEHLKVEAYHLICYFNDLFSHKIPTLDIKDSAKILKKQLSERGEKANKLQKSIRQYSKVKPLEPLKLLGVTLLENIIVDEFNPKYRKLKSTAKKLQDVFFVNDSGENILKLIGFDKVTRLPEYSRYENNYTQPEVKEAKRQFLEALRAIENKS